MTNIEKYNDAFVEVFGVDSAVLNDSFSKDSVESIRWSSCRRWLSGRCGRCPTSH